MFLNCKKQLFFLLPILLCSGIVHSQFINKKKIDSLLKNGQNYTALREINSIDTLHIQKSDLALFYYYKAKCLAAENKNAKAFQIYLQAKNVYLAIDSLDRAMAINLDIAYFLSVEKNNRKKGENYIKAYLNYALKKDENLLIAKAYSNWGSLDMEEQPLKSLKLFKKSIYYSEKSQDYWQLENVYSNIAVLYNEILQKPDTAIYYIDRSIVYAKKNNNNNGICVNLINKASCYYYKNNFEEAIKLLEEANTITLPQNNKSIKSFIYEFLAINYNELKSYEKAYANLNKSITIKSEFNSAEQNKKISEFNIKYETKEKEIENLTLKTKIQQNQIITYASLGLVLIIIILTVLIYKNLSKKKKIAEQKQLIQSQKLEKTLKDREFHDIDVMLESQEHERQQIANELHDNLGSLLATLN
jgi:hypothetical protein